MAAGLLIVVFYSALIWVVFFKFKWLKFSIPWAVVSLYVGVHLLLIFMVGLRFMTPSSSTVLPRTALASALSNCQTRRAT